LTTSKTLLNFKIIGKGQGHRGVLVCLASIILIYEMLFAKRRHCVTARGSVWRYLRAALSLEQGLSILF